MADENMVSGGIGVVLPARETFGIRKSGAIALCARDFAAHSRFASRITILGAAACEYPDVRYLQLTGWWRWWRRRRAAYANAVIAAAKAQRLAMLEVQNRPYMIAAVREALPNTKLALHLHNDPQTMDESRTSAAREELLRQVDAVYCVSRFIHGRFLEGIADPEGKAIVVYNGIASAAPIVPKEAIIAFAGRVIAIKGVVELVRAFTLAAPSLPGWRLMIAGDDPDGLLTGPHSRIARERETLGERLLLLGQVSHSEAMTLFARAEIAAVPSLWDDPCPRSAIEALASGCALIATARGGLAEITDGAGEIVDPLDVEAFAAALRRVAGDAAWRKELQGRALSKARGAFDIARVTATLDAARENLLKAPSADASL